jgi:hypothetical protein
MDDPAKKSRLCCTASTVLFVIFCLTSGGEATRLISPAAGEAARIISTLAGIFSWTLMCVAYDLQKRRAAKSSP